RPPAYLQESWGTSRGSIPTRRPPPQRRPHSTDSTITSDSKSPRRFLASVETNSAMALRLVAWGLAVSVPLATPCPLPPTSWLNAGALARRVVGIAHPLGVAASICLRR